METTILGSRYELLERVGMGGMAVVYKAKDKMLNRYVAVKILREEFKENEDFIRRFKVESQAAACLSHQNIVQVYDVGEENGLHYIVMEFLEGYTLKQYINAKGGKLSRREATNFSMQICRALEHAHSKHVVHRDIKPQNIVITESGKLKVTDFGIARAANNSTTVNSGSGSAVGSAHYLSPEQGRGGYTDHRSDIYSLGVVMYEMFTGKLPFDAEESVSVVMQHLHEEPVLPCEINPDLPAGIEAIIIKAMRKEQRFRYSSAGEILEDLVMVYQNPGIEVSKLNAYINNEEIIPSSHSASQRSSKSRAVSKKKKKSSKKGLIAAILLLVVAIFSMLALALYILFAGTGKEVEIPYLVGLTHSQASLEAENASQGNVTFKVLIKSHVHSDKEKDTIIFQSPEGGSKVKQPRDIEVVVSLGPVVLELDNYIGKSYEEIKEKLEESGLTVILEHSDNDSYDEGTIFRQVPSEGTQMAKGDEVTLYVSKGTEYTIVPNVLGDSLEEAIVTIERNNLKFRKNFEAASNKYSKGEVCKLSISPDEKVRVGTEIDIYVSNGEKENSQNGETDNSQKPDGKDPKPSVSPGGNKKEVALTLNNLPKDKSKVRIRLVLDGKIFHEADYSTSTGSATIAMETDKSLSLDVYYDGVYITTKEVKY